MNNDLEDLLKDLIAKSLAKKDAGFFSALGLTVAIVIGLFFLDAKLNDQASELAKLKAQAELDQLKAKSAANKALTNALDDERIVVEQRASVHLMAAEENAAMVENLQRQHEQQIAAVQAIKNNDWDTLNKLAGVQ
jgi:multidrug efflux pump subunit AcrA (membrane-fusion protein)